ncbi:hypothetical protein H6G89_32375 [Oscillatoria sp. FACHB-1407]|uniref:tetratricopeptide repeat protein n=1 Tax=Oscillatoria sp. FACHB-1407 TaxID=2692847 RepID=UPI0016826947|nr:hypothetical protein [Oscillatoria sp. FACHB-1407]MBD2465688.1 hypothetical protein [Oscillatoria sp. FACHB-1407]
MGQIPASSKPLSQAEFRTTDGAIALINLNSQIEGQLWQFRRRNISAVQGAGLVELFAMRGQFLSNIGDYEYASQLAEQLVQKFPTDANSFFARARTHTIFHRFSAALADLNCSEQLGYDDSHVNAARATILQAIGHYEQALTIRQRAVETNPNIDTLGAFAVLQLDRGDFVTAEQLMIAAQESYSGISPFPIAWLYFQWGHLCVQAGNLSCACAWFKAASHRFPAYAAAQGHLAEINAALGNDEVAIILLRPLALSADDPDYAAQLSSILSKTGQDAEAKHWRTVAAIRYEELVDCYPEAFADHASRFWLGTGADPLKALQLAQKNLEVRQTPQAYSLLNQAAVANQERR